MGISVNQGVLIVLTAKDLGQQLCELLGYHGFSATSVRDTQFAYEMLELTVCPSTS